MELDKFYKTFFLRDVLGYVCPGAMILVVLLMACADQAMVDRLLVSTSPWKFFPLAIAACYFLGVVNREFWVNLIPLDYVSEGPIRRSDLSSASGLRSKLRILRQLPPRLLWCNLVRLHESTEARRGYRLFATSVTTRERAVEYAERLLLLHIIYKNFAAALMTASILFGWSWERSLWSGGGSQHVLSIVDAVVGAWLPTAWTATPVGLAAGFFMLLVSGWTLKNYWLNVAVAEACKPSSEASK